MNKANALMFGASTFIAFIICYIVLKVSVILYFLTPPLWLIVLLPNRHFRNPSILLGAISGFIISTFFW